MNWNISKKPRKNNKYYPGYVKTQAESESLNGTKESGPSHQSSNAPLEGPFKKYAGLPLLEILRLENITVDEYHRRIINHYNEKLKRGEVRLPMKSTIRYEKPKQSNGVPKNSSSSTNGEWVPPSLDEVITIDFKST